MMEFYMINSRKIYLFKQTVFILFNYFFIFLLAFPVKISHLNCYKGKYILFVISIIYYVIYLCRNKFIINWDKPSKIVYLLVIIASINAFISIVKYDSISVSCVFRALYPFFICFLFFPLNDVFKDAIKKELFIKILTIINIIAIIIILFQAYLYNNYHILFISVYEFTQAEEVAIRGGNFRLTYLDTMILLSFVISLGYMVRGRCIKHFFNVFLSFIYIYCVSQTRSEIVICFILIIIAIQQKYNLKGQFTRGLKLLFILVLISIFLILNIEGIKSKFYSVSFTSFSTRLEEINYYINLLKNNIICGVGLFDPLKGENYYEILHGINGKYTITDIGILGQSARLGIQIICWYVYFIKYLFTNVKKDKRNLFLALYVLMTSVNLIVLDNQRIITIPIVIALVNTSRKENLKDVVIGKELYETAEYY